MDDDGRRRKRKRQQPQQRHDPDNQHHNHNKQPRGHHGGQQEKKKQSPPPSRAPWVIGGGVVVAVLVIAGIAFFAMQQKAAADAAAAEAERQRQADMQRSLDAMAASTFPDDGSGVDMRAKMKANQAQSAEEQKKMDEMVAINKKLQGDIDLFKVCDWETYGVRYPEVVQAVGGPDLARLADHFKTKGINENKNCKADPKVWDRAAYAKEASRYTGPDGPIVQSVSADTAFGHWWAKGREWGICPSATSWCADRDCDWQSYWYRHEGELGPAYADNAWRLRQHYARHGNAGKMDCTLDTTGINARRGTPALRNWEKKNNPKRVDDYYTDDSQIKWKV